MPPSSTVPLREPASSRTAEWLSVIQGEASSARARVGAAQSEQGGSEQGTEGNHCGHADVFRE